MKFISTLLKIKKNISNTMSILILANKKVFLKNQSLFASSSIENDVITIPKISKLEPLIFLIPTLVC